MVFNLSEECELLWQQFHPWLMCFTLRSRTVHTIRRTSKTFPLRVLQLFKSIGDAACRLGGRDLSPTLRAAILDVWFPGICLIYCCRGI